MDELDVRRIQPSKRALRRDLGSLGELMASIEERGLLHPIVVRPLEDGFEVVAGNRRLEACKRLGWRRIPCHIIEIEDREAYEVSLIENVQRRTLNPIEEAEAYQRYVSDYGYGGISELSRRIGKSQEFVTRRIQLLTLPKRVQTAVMRRRIHTSTAQELLALDDDDMQEHVGGIVVKESLSKIEVRHIVRLLRQSPLPDSLPGHFHSAERLQRLVDRALSKTIASMKICLMRMSDALHDVEEDFLVSQVLLECRMNVSQQLDSLYRLKKKIQRAPPLLK